MERGVSNLVFAEHSRKTTRIRITNYLIAMNHAGRIGLDGLYLNYFSASNASGNEFNSQSIAYDAVQREKHSNNFVMVN